MARYRSKRARQQARRELIHFIHLAIPGETIHVHPDQAEAARKAASRLRGADGIKIEAPPLKKFGRWR